MALPDPTNKEQVSAAVLRDAEAGELGLVARFGQYIEHAVIVARWFMAPIYVGLFVVMLLVVVKFVQRLLAAIPAVLAQDTSETMLTVLSLIDLALIGNLIVIVMLAGDFSSVKMKLIGSITVIAAVYLLESFMNLRAIPVETLLWQVIILLVLGITGVLLALMDRICEKH